jgi:hypothetical protein
VAKWRTVFTGWQLGTREKGDPEGDAVRDHRELTLLLRIEVQALTALMIKKGVFSEREFGLQVIEEAEFFDKQLEKRFPGFRATDDGMQMTMPEAAETMRGWRP